MQKLGSRLSQNVQSISVLADTRYDEVNDDSIEEKSSDGGASGCPRTTTAEPSCSRAFVIAKRV